MKLYINDEARRIVLFADNLRHIIRTKNISVTKLARQIGISTTMIHQYKSGKSFPNDYIINKLADGLGCTVDDLFDDTYAPWNFGSDEN
jgi:transcriptional regulator with XRE-family HTH domain